MSNLEHCLSTNIVYLKKLITKKTLNELLYNCISSTEIYIEKPSIWWPEKYFSHDKMQFFGIFWNYENKYCCWSFGNTIEIMVLIGRRDWTMCSTRVRFQGLHSSFFSVKETVSQTLVKLTTDYSVQSVCSHWAKNGEIV